MQDLLLFDDSISNTIKNFAPREQRPQHDAYKRAVARGGKSLSTEEQVREHIGVKLRIRFFIFAFLIRTGDPPLLKF